MFKQKKINIGKNVLRRFKKYSALKSQSNSIIQIIEGRDNK